MQTAAVDSLVSVCECVVWWGWYGVVPPGVEPVAMSHATSVGAMSLLGTYGGGGVGVGHCVGMPEVSDPAYYHQPYYHHGNPYGHHPHLQPQPEMMGCGGDYWSDSARSVSSGRGTPTGEDDPRYLNLDTVVMGGGGGGYGMYGGGSGAELCGPGYDLQDTSSPVIRVVKRRNTANKKERRRTQSINNAFADLRDCIPNVPADTKLSKIKTLRLATSYIGYLMGVLDGNGEDCGDGFKADLTSHTRRASRQHGQVQGEGQKVKGRTGWPQHVWALELKPETV